MTKFLVLPSTKLRGLAVLQLFWDLELFNTTVDDGVLFERIPLSFSLPEIDSRIPEDCLSSGDEAPQ